MNIIFDIDGTLMDIEHRRHFVEDSKEVKSLKEALDNLSEIEGDEWIFLTNKIKELSVKKDWKSFVDNIKHDVPNKLVASVMCELNNHDNSMFFLTGRNEASRYITIKQLEECGYNNQKQAIEVRPKDDIECIYYPDGHYDNILFMRPDDDYRPDAEVKSELFDKIVNTWTFLFNGERGTSFSDTIIFDDRQSVVDMWRSRGLTCFQVAKGDF
jgi:hypothetical protein